MDQFVAELGRDVQFALTVIKPTILGGLTDPAPGTAAQFLSRQVDGSNIQTAFGHLERVSIRVNPMDEEISTADALFANYEDWKTDWQLDVMGIRRLGAATLVGLSGQAVNPISEFIFENIASSDPLVRFRRAKLVILTYDRQITFIGKPGPYAWDYSGARNTDSMSLKSIDIGGPNVLYAVRS